MVSNNTTMAIHVLLESKSIIDILNFITQEVMIYVPLVLVILGFIGFIGNVFTFLQSEFRSNTCCIYLLVGSIVDIINLIVNLFPYFLAAKYGLYFPWYISSSMCKLNAFLTMFIPHLSINFVLMAMIDRFACTCSLTSSVRRLNQLKMIPWMVGILLIFSGLASIYAPVLYDKAFGVPWCMFTYVMTASIFYIVFMGFMQPCLILIFVLLTYRNVRRSRRQVGITNLARRNRSRNQFIVMIFTHVLTTAFFSLQWIVMFTYVSITSFNVSSYD
ncbi:unnamed protein product, partial [Adineta steineri]